MRQRRREHAGADVGDVDALEQALEGPVLAERAVQRREHDVDALDAAAGRKRHLPAGLAPDAVASDLDPANLVAGALEAL